MIDPRWLIGTLAHRALPDGRLAVVVPLTFDRARLCVTESGGDGSSYDYSY